MIYPQTVVPLAVGQEQSIKLIDAGSGYKQAPAVVLSGGGGSGAEAAATVKDGRVTEIKLAKAGSGYISDPLVTLVGGPRVVSKCFAQIANGHQGPPVVRKRRCSARK